MDVFNLLLCFYFGRGPSAACIAVDLVGLGRNRSQCVLEYFLNFDQHNTIPLETSYELEEVVKDVVSFELLDHDVRDVNEHGT